MDVLVEFQKEDEFKRIYQKFNSMVYQLKTLINQVYKQTILTQKAELKHLQSQITPHFLYNSFFLLSTFSKIGDYESAEKLADQLGIYFKFTTRNSSDTVPLIEEIKHANIYTDIQAQRFGRRLTISFEELPKEYENIEVPRLIVQPIIENSFSYGLEGKTMGAELHIYFEESEDYLKIIIEDNGSSIENEEVMDIQTKLLESQQGDNIEITGLTNIHKRLKLFYDDRCGITVSKGKSSGLKVTLNIAIKGRTTENV
jgi:two-component system sensor histidine kinase YesM